MSKNPSESKDTDFTAGRAKVVETSVSSAVDHSEGRNSPAARIEKLILEPRKSSSSVSEESVDDWGKMEENPASGVTSDLEDTHEPKETDGWDEEDQWQDFAEEKPVAPKLFSLNKNVVGVIEKKSTAKKETFKSFAVASKANTSDNVEDEFAEYSYTSRKPSKPPTTDDDMWASLGGRTSSTSSSAKKSLKSEDDLFASLSVPAVRKSTRLDKTSQKKRGPMKLGAQKLPW